MGHGASQLLLAATGALLVGGLATAAGTALAEALSCAPCGASPVQADRVLLHEAALNLSSDRDLQRLDATSARVKGLVLAGRQVPFNYRLVVGKAETVRGKRLYRAGLLLSGSFHIAGNLYRFLLVERWKDGISVRLYHSRRDVLQRFCCLRVSGAKLHDCSETPEFASSKDARSMVTWIHAELRRVFRASGFNDESDLQQAGLTNCMLFAIRAGQQLGGADGFLKASLGAIQG